LAFPFNSDSPTLVYACMGGNLSVRRDRVLSMGGFDENFVGAAYRFEAEFGRRVWRSGGRILFDPAASIRHLQAERGGTRSYGSHLRSMRPAHSVGDYYFALSQGLSVASAIYCLKRLTRSTMTRYHLYHPWWIVPKMIGELSGLTYAVRLVAAGPRLLPAPTRTTLAHQAVGNDAARQLYSQEPQP
jgi:GT2 family glycosyltransferase